MDSTIEFLLERFDGDAEALLKALVHKRARMIKAGVIKEIDTPFGQLIIIVNPLFRDSANLGGYE